MQLTRHATPHGPRWACNGRFLSPSFRLSHLLELSASFVLPFLDGVTQSEPAEGPLLPPIEADHEVWASGVTYLRSRDARTAESRVTDIYDRVYAATRPELFLKATGSRVVGHGMPIRVRRDSQWNAPEPELTLVLNHALEVVGYAAGNDVCSRDIEADNPLYLPQAKVYDGSCAVGPGIQLSVGPQLADLPIELEVDRGGKLEFRGSTRSSEMKRSQVELAGYLGRELSFPSGTFLMTGTGIVPPDEFSLQPGDRVRVRVGELLLENGVAEE